MNADPNEIANSDENSRQEHSDETNGETLEDLKSPPAGPAAEGKPSLPTDRGLPSVNRPRSLQLRLSRLVAFVLMLTLGGGLMGWYYQKTATRQSRIADMARVSAQSKAAGESTVPPLDVRDSADDAFERGKATRLAGTAGRDAAISGSNDTPVFEKIMSRPAEPNSSRAVGQVYRVQRRPGDAAMAGSGGGVAGTAAVGGAYAPVPAVPSELERRLAGPAFAAKSGASGAESGLAALSDPATGLANESAESAPALTATESSASRTALAAQLKPTVLAAAQAKLLPTRQLLLPKGARVDCTLETAIDSSLPGLTTCLTATDTFGADGKVVLLERGTLLVGETRGEARRSGKRLFVLWSEARTPTGVVVEFASPATDALGRAGLTGEVDRHFWERFGAATLLSVLDGALQAGVEASRQSNSSAIDVSPSASRDILGEALHDTADITPTIRVAPGTRLQVLVARDLDFRSVYVLQYRASP